MSTGIIIGMTTITVVSAVSQKVFSAIGKNDEAQYLDLATKTGLATTALTIFATFIKAVAKF